MNVVTFSIYRVPYPFSPIPEHFNFDDEHYLFEYDPEGVYDIDDSPCHFFNGQLMNYQDLLQVSEMTSKLVHAWIRRYEAIKHDEDFDSKCNEWEIECDPLLDFYQLDSDDRELLKARSVSQVLQVLEGKKGYLNLQYQILEIVRTVKMVMMELLHKFLPSLPYTALKLIMTHLIQAGGMKSIGTLTEGREEMDCVVKLYSAIVEVFDGLKVVMFNTDEIFLPPLSSRVDDLEQQYLSFSSFMGPWINLMATNE